MKVIVTGGAGFIGSHLAEKLTKIKKIKKIVIIDHLRDGSLKNLNKILKNKKIVILRREIRNLKSIQKVFKNVYCVFHLAAIADIVPSIVNPKDYVDTNFGGTINVLEAMRLNKVKKIIYAASSSCYGLTPSKVNEEHKISTLYPYLSQRKLRASRFTLVKSVWYKYISQDYLMFMDPDLELLVLIVMGVFLKQNYLINP